MSDIDVCQCNMIHGDIVDVVKKSMPDSKLVEEMADFFKVFGDPTRVRILSALLTAEMCVCDIAHVLEMKQSAISHQLRLLKKSRLVKNRRDGKVVYYSLDDDHVKKIIELGTAHITHK